MISHLRAVYWYQTSTLLQPPLIFIYTSMFPFASSIKQLARAKMERKWDRGGGGLGRKLGECSFKGKQELFFSCWRSDPGVTALQRTLNRRFLSIFLNKNLFSSDKDHEASPPQELNVLPAERHKGGSRPRVSPAAATWRTAALFYCGGRRISPNEIPCFIRECDNVW